MKAFKRTAVYIAIFIILVMAGSIPGAAIAQDQSDWDIYFHPGIRFGTDDRVIGFYDVLVPVYLTDTSMLFINPRFSHDSTHGHEWNLGGGYRQILWDDQLMLGLNAYYDLKKDGRSGYWFDQWGMGFEAMGEFDNVLAEGGGLGLTGRFNFYIPLSGEKTEGGVGVGGGGYTFKTLGIYGGGGSVVYEPLTGLDYEMGMRIPYLSEYVETWAYAGGYHYWASESGNMDGFCGRIEVIPTDFVALDFEYRNDNWYGDEFYGEVKVEVPFSIDNLVAGKNPFEGLGSRFGGSRDLHERMSEPVRRDIDIKIETVETGDPTTTGGLIEEVVFVSEGGETDPLADGTFEHPYGTIGEAMADPRIGVTAFTIHVINDNGGDGVVYTGVGGTVNIPGMLLWGCGAPHPLYGAVCGMSSGYPDMSDGFTIDGNNIEVFGLRFTGSAGLGINGGTGISVHHNEFIGPGIGSGRGIESTGTTNSLTVSDNLFQDWHYGIYLAGGDGMTISRNDITNCYMGIRTYGGSNISVFGNTINVAVEGIYVRRSDGFDLIASVTGNTITADGTGIASDANGINLMTSGGGDLFGNISGNSLYISDDDNGGSAMGIRCTASGGIAYPTIRNNYMELSAYDSTAVTGGSCLGIMVFGENGVGGPGAGDALRVTGNTVTIEAYNGFNGMHISSGNTSGSYLYASGAGYGIRNNTITGRAYESGSTWGMNLSSGSSGGVGGDMNVDITGNSIDILNWNSTTSTGGYAVGIYLNADNDLFGTVSNNPLISVEGRSDIAGIYTSVNGDTGSITNPFTIIDNSSITCIGHNTAGGYVRGIYMYSSAPGADMFARVTGNTNIDLTAAAGYIYGITTLAGGLLGDSSSSFATLISGNNCTLHSGAGINNYGMYLRNGAAGTTNWVDLGSGTAGSTGSNNFTLLGAGATWNGTYAGNIIRLNNFTMPPDRIDP